MSVTEIGRRLKRARLDAKLTQKEAADRLGITYQAISNYERGTNRVDTDTLTKLCAIYGVKIGDLLRAPAWDQDMFDAFNSAKTPQAKDALIKLWGCPAELIEYNNNRREPDPNPLTPEDEFLLYKYHHLDESERAALVKFLNQSFTVPTTDESDLLHKYRRLDDAAKGRIRHMVDYEYSSIPGSASEAASQGA